MLAAVGRCNRIFVNLRCVLHVLRATNKRQDLQKAAMAAQVLKRINAEIEGRRRAGEDLPPPPKTAIAGPEYFGLNQPEVQYRPPLQH